MKLAIGNEILEVDDNLDTYNSLRKTYLNTALAFAGAFEKKYDEYKNSNDFWDKTMQMFAEILVMQSEHACKLLFSCGIYDMTQEQFIEKYFDAYLNPDRYIDAISEKLQSIEDFAKLRQAGREINKATRMRWSGGGFSIGGAITSAIASSLFNTAGGIAYTVGNAFANASDKRQIEKIRIELFRDPDTFCHMCSAVYYYAFGCFFALRDELIEHNILKPIIFDAEKAEALHINASKFAASDEEAFALYAKSACMYPYDSNLYLKLCSCCKNCMEVDTFSEYFGIKQESEFFHQLDISALIMSAKQLPEKDLEETVVKLHTLVSMIPSAVQTNVSLSDSISRISNSIFQKQGISYGAVCEAERCINRHFEGQEREAISQLIADLASKKYDFEKQQAKQDIENMPAEKISQAIEKIRAIIEYSNRYSDDMAEDVTYLLRSISAGRLDPLDCEKIALELNGLRSKNYPQIEIVIDGLKQKQEFLQISQSCVDVHQFCTWKDIFVFSPFILDIINKARSGSPVHQLWVINMLLPDEMLTNSILLNPEISHIALSENDKQVIAENIAFLFDKPGEWAFDLFMRFRTMLWTETVDDYCEMLEAFADADSCPAAQFECGRYMMENKESDEAISLIEKAAQNNYYPAIIYMLRYSWSKAQEYTGKVLFYDTVSSGIIPLELYKFSYFGKMYEHDWRLDSFRVNRYKGFHQFLSIYRCPEDVSHHTLVHCLKSICDQIGLKNYGKGCTYNFGISGIDRDNDRFIAQVRKKDRIDTRDEDIIFAFRDERENGYSMLITTKRIYRCQRKAVKCENITPDNFLSWSDEIFCDEHESLRNNDLWQVYSVLYYRLISYGKTCDLPTLEKMALCGNPYAISHMIALPDTSKERSEVWNRIKENWERKGLYFRVCPRCFVPRTIDDAFCPECGTKVN